MIQKFLAVFIGYLFLCMDVVCGQIKVVVHDHDNNPLAYVNTVMLGYDAVETIIGASGNESGLVVYNNLDPGEYMLVMIYLGYVNDTVKGIVVSGGDYLDLGVRTLDPESFILEEVNIIGKAPVIIRTANQLIYNIEKTTMATGETALSLLSNVPGVIVSSRNNIMVNGKDNVIVLIDGRQQYLTGDELTNILRSLSSESIKQVVVMNSASAKYDASGGGAVINIVSKRSALTGLYGSVWARYRQGRYPSGFSGINMNWKVKKFSGNLYYYFSAYQGFHDINISRKVEDLGPGNNPLYFKETIDEMWTQLSHAPRMRLFYDINDHHRIGLQADLLHLQLDFPNKNIIEISDDGEAADSFVLSDIQTDEMRFFPYFQILCHFPCR